MADITFAPSSVPTLRLRRPGWLDTLAHRTEVLRRRARRNRYLALVGRSPRRYPWFETMITSMSGR